MTDEKYGFSEEEIEELARARDRLLKSASEELTGDVAEDASRVFRKGVLAPSPLFIDLIFAKLTAGKGPEQQGKIRGTMRARFAALANLWARISRHQWRHNLVMTADKATVMPLAKYSLEPDLVEGFEDPGMYLQTAQEEPFALSHRWLRAAARSMELRCDLAEKRGEGVQAFEIREIQELLEDAGRLNPGQPRDELAASVRSLAFGLLESAEHLEEGDRSEEEALLTLLRVRNGVDGNNENIRDNLAANHFNTLVDAYVETCRESGEKSVKEWAVLASSYVVGDFTTKVPSQGEALGACQSLICELIEAKLRPPRGRGGRKPGERTVKEVDEALCKEMNWTPTDNRSKKSKKKPR